MTYDTSKNDLAGFQIYGDVTVGSKGQIVIPSKARKNLGLSEGSRLMAMSSPNGRAIMLIRMEAFEQLAQNIATHVADVTDTEA